MYQVVHNRTLVPLAMACALLSCLSLSDPVAAFSVVSSSTVLRRNSNNECIDIDRRRVIQDIVISICGGISGAVAGFSADAANLPTSTGADMSHTGTVDALIPIVKMENALLDAKKQLSDARNSGNVSSDTIKSVSMTLSSAIPSEPTLFKRRFDEYSDPVSYKQKFMDQNAFLVYYTKGFDGPNRPPIESRDAPVPRQTLQYGLRNDAWAEMDDVFAELSFFVSGSSNLSDILDPLERTIAAFEAYLSYAPAVDVEEARLRIR